MMITLPNIGLFDICLACIYIFIIYFFAFRYQQKKIKTNPEFRYFLVGLTAKIIGSISFVLISIYYYQGGDAFRFFKIAENIRTHLFTDFSETLKLLITPFSDLSSFNYDPIQGNYYYERNTTWFFARLIFIFNMLSFGSYLVSSILLSVVSFIGLWLGYSTLCRLYPRARTMLLIPFFLIPTAAIWSSGILRDTLVIGVLGILIFFCANSFIFKKQIFYNLMGSVGCLFLILFLKPILLFVLIPCLIVWCVSYFIKKEFSFQKKGIAIAVGLIITLGAGYFINNAILIKNPKYQVGNLIHTLKGFQSFHPDYPKAKSVYTLGEMDYTPLGIIIKVPEAINVTFFRPYFWEINSVPTLLAATEVFLLFLFFILVLVIIRGKLFIAIITNREVIFMLLFSISYAVITGLSAYNFGALSRFKIPAILFFCVALIIIFSKYKTFKIDKNNVV